MTEQLQLFMPCCLCVSVSLAQTTSQAGDSLSVAVNLCFGLQVLHGFCSDILASKPTSLEADQQLLEKLPAGANTVHRQQMALQFRIGKKVLLKSCIWRYDPAQVAA